MANITSNADVVLSGRFRPDQERQYNHVSFWVPEGTRQFHLRASYTHRIASDPMLGGGNTLDIGMFDTRGREAGSPGFRGWSGSELLEITIGEDWATPPYRPGPLTEGAWYFLLGAYKVSPAGLDWQIELWFNPELAQPESVPTPHDPVRPDLPHAARPDWFRGDLHCHTRNSDGDSWPIDVLVAAAEAGLDFLAITDHNSAIRPALTGDEPAEIPVLLPGIEVTTYAGHWNAWGGTGSWYDFREPSAEGIKNAARAARETGAFISVNHPKPFGPAWSFTEIVDQFDAIEIWNGPWERLNSIALAAWDERLRRGERLVAVGGSDTHFLTAGLNLPLPAASLGQPTTWVKTEDVLSPESILAALRAGDCFVTASPSGPQLYLDRESDGISIQVVGGAGLALTVWSNAGCLAACAVQGNDWETHLPWPTEATYMRAQLGAPNGDVVTVSNAVWAE
jgi:hypothetical protein